MGEWRFVVAGYLLTAVGLLGYAARLMRRGRRAAERRTAISERRRLETR
jgi:hypothetical protein